MSLLSRGSIHQGHERFSGDSRGKQCSFMSLSAPLTAETISVDIINSGGLTLPGPGAKNIFGPVIT